MYQPEECYYSGIVPVAKADVSNRMWDKKDGSKRQRTGAEAKEYLRVVRAAH